MAIEITVPRLGWNMEEGIFQGWLKKDGEQVLAGEPLFCLETDKATQEVEGLDGGILKIRPDGPKEGDTVTVGALIAYLVQPGENPTFQLESIASSSSSEDGSRATVVSSGMPSGDVIRASLGEGDAGQRMSRGEADSPRSGGTHSS
ncbi:MAG: lipoyl domain-containing protein, partial [Terriglobia bacterium]